MANLIEKAVPIGSSTTAKTALGLGIAGTVLGGGAALATGGGLLGNLFGARPATVGYPAPGAIVTVDASGVPVAYGGGCNCYVTQKEMCLIRENGAKDAEISLLKSEKYTAEYVNASLAPVYAKLHEQNKEICDLKADLRMESERRACGDEKLLTYVDGNYIKAEKSLNSKKINYHGVKPTLVIDECCCDA